MVPSSPYGPCSTGNTTSTEASSSPAARASSDSSSPRRPGSAGSASAVPDAPLTSGSRPSVIARVSGVGVGEHPRAARGDADGDHLEPLRVEVAQDAARGNTGNRVLGAASAVDDGDTDATGGAGLVAGSHNLERLPPRPEAAGSTAATCDFHLNACSISAIRSSVSSMPAEMRAKPSLTGSPQRARRSTEVWMPPKLVEETSRSLRCTSSWTASRVCELDRHESAEALHLPCSRPRCDGSSGRPG